MGKDKPEYLRAKEGFVTVYNGDQIAIAAGELVPAGHPFLKRREDLFEPVTRLSRFDTHPQPEPEPEPEPQPEVEQATAAPGEKRGPGRPRKNP
jgi:hypothetical protein